MMTRFVERYLAAIWLLACLALGGAASAGFVANAFLQISAIALILFLTLGRRIPSLPANGRALLLLVVAAGALTLIQLVPMPEALWSRLPGRSEVAHGFALAGAGSPWLPIALAPDATIAALLSLLPPLAMILTIFAASGHGRVYAIYALVLFAVASIVLGFAQISGGIGSPLYLYDVTNRGSPVGFFSNRNHLATLLLGSIPFAAMLAVSSRRGGSADIRIGRRLIALCVVALLALGIVYARSDAGWALLLPALLAGGAVFEKGERGRLSKGFGLVVGVALVVAIALAPIVLKDANRKLLSSGSQMRSVIIATTLTAAWDYFPVGSGGGSFPLIYPSYEDPEAATGEFINHAHCDYAEFALEYGVPGAILLIGALFWWIRCVPRIWRSAGVEGGLARGGFVAIGLVAAHSLVDYPVRTAAIAALLGMAGALLAAPSVDDAPPLHARHRERKPSTRTIMIGLSDETEDAASGNRTLPRAP